MAESMHDDILEVLLSEEEIHAKVRELGARITADYAGKTPFFLGVLKGCFVFMSDLTRCVDLPCTLDFMAVSSYGGGTSSTGAVRITKDLTRDIEGKDVIIVEDILDSGITLSYLKQYLQNRKPASIRIVTLLDKPSRRKADITADYCGFSVPDEFVVGYGLDYAEAYRNLPYIGILKPEIYSR
jgi:hypoxanthine phosphoribosyltransferase